MWQNEKFYPGKQINLFSQHICVVKIELRPINAKLGLKQKQCHLGFIHHSPDEFIIQL